MTEEFPWPGYHAGLPAPPPGPAPPSTGRPPGSPRRGRVVVASLLAALVLLSGGIGLTGGALWRDESSSTAPGAFPRADAGKTSTVEAAVGPAIVNINTQRIQFDSSGTRLVPLGSGTGMILTSTGEVLTNNHVIEGSSRIDVEIAGRSGTFTADVVGVHPTDDVALLQVKGVTGLPTVTVGEASSLRLGQEVIAIGNALGRGGAPTATIGTVSGLHRSITARDPGGDSEQLDDLIQSDAAIQPGDSGGALVTSNGEVVGMITAGASTGAFLSPSRVGFAIPVENALDIVTEIRAGNASSTILLGERGFLGVSIDLRFDFSTASDLGIDATSGAMVKDVQPGSPADRAGMVAPLVIRSIDDRSILSPDQLGPVLQAHEPGDRVMVAWVDANGTHTASVELGGGGPAA